MVWEFLDTVSKNSHQVDPAHGLRTGQALQNVGLRTGQNPASGHQKTGPNQWKNEW
jgi:hypothetical protein